MASRIITRFLFLLIVSLSFTNILVSCRHEVRAPLDGLFIGIHDKIYEDAFIEFKENGLVQVQTTETKTRIVFRPVANKLARYNIGSITRVTFECGGKVSSNCDLFRPYKLYVSSVMVEPVEVVKKTAKIS